MYSFSYLEPVCHSMSSSNCCFLTSIQVSQEAGQVDWYSRLLKNFPQFIVIHTVKSFGIVNKAEIDVFLKLSCFFDDSADVDNLIPGSSAFSKSSLNIFHFVPCALVQIASIHICFSSIILYIAVSNSKSIHLGTSLVVQWLRLNAPCVEGLGLISVQQTRSTDLSKLDLTDLWSATKILHAQLEKTISQDSTKTWYK